MDRLLIIVVIGNKLCINASRKEKGSRQNLMIRKMKKVKITSSDQGRLVVVF